MTRGSHLELLDVSGRDTVTSERPEPAIRRPTVRRVVIGAVDDRYELEADRAADAVISAITTAEQQWSPAGGSRIQRMAIPTGAGVGPSGGELDDELAARILRRAGAGTPLSPPVRRRLEHGFGTDLGHVRVHRDGESAAVNRALSARAFALGDDVHLGADVPDPSTPDGARVLAHEVAHVVQQTGRVQRYTERATDPSRSSEVAKFVKNFQRSSSGGGILQISEQKMMVRNDILATSEAALVTQGSFIQLVGEPASEGYSWVKVKFRGATAGQQRDEDVRRLATAAAKSEPERRDDQLAELRTVIEANGLETNVAKVAGAKSANEHMDREVGKLQHPGAEGLFLTVRDCHRTARSIMGDLGITTKREHAIVDDTTGTIKKILPDLSKDKANFATDGHAAAIAFLKFALSEDFAVMVDKVPDTASIAAQVRAIAGSWSYTKAMLTYGNIQAHPVVGPLFNRTFKVNDHARVAVGQALTQVNDENERLKAVDNQYVSPRTGKLEDLWNFHWAGVVLIDGTDYVTLQAVADQQATTLTVNWWFKMYGSGDQSFHSEEKEDPHVGSRPLTLSIAAQQPAAKPRAFGKTLIKPVD